MDRKYRQAGYMDRDRDRNRDREKQDRQKRPQQPKGPKEFRSRPMPGFNEVFRCSMCGAKVLDAEIGLDQQCLKCKADLHSCKQCSFFDTGARLECTQPITERISRKNGRNECTLFKMKKSVERETSSSSSSVPSGGTSSARQAFDNLFKK